MPPAVYRFEPQAGEEFNQAIRYYAAEAGKAVAAGFIAQVEADVAAICTAPELWRIAKPPDVRRYVLRRFPYLIYYLYHAAENLVVIYALVHASRQPGYWHARLSSEP